MKKCYTCCNYIICEFVYSLLDFDELSFITLIIIVKLYCYLLEKKKEKTRII